MQSPSAEQRAEFQRLAVDMSKRIANAIEGQHSPYVVLEALFLVHRYTAHQLPPDVVGTVSMAVAAYAGELLQTSANQSAPVGAPIH